MTAAYEPEYVDQGDQWDEWDRNVTPEMMISFGVPHVPYSQIRIPLTREGIAQGVAAAKLLYDTFFAEFSGFPVTIPQQGGDPRDYSAQGVGQSLTPRQPRPQNEAYIVGFCPEHRDERGLQAAVKLTAPQYQDPERHDKVYHPLLEKDQYPDKRTGQPVRNHNFYWRLTVDADGYSNKDRPVPGTTDPDDQPF